MSHLRSGGETDQLMALGGEMVSCRIIVEAMVFFVVSLSQRELDYNK